MSSLTDAIKEKYSEDIGWSFTLFEIAVFFIYLTAIHSALTNPGASIWQALWSKSAYSIFVGPSSTLQTARAIDYLFAAALVAATKSIYRFVGKKVYDYLFRMRDMESYVRRLGDIYKKECPPSPALRLYIANEITEQKRIYMKRITSIHGFGLTLLGLCGTLLIGALTLHPIDLVVLIPAFSVVLAFEWRAFISYTAEVVPRMVLEKTLRGEDPGFGDDYSR